MRLAICTGCHAREDEKHFAGWIELLQSRLGVGYFGGEGQGIEVDFVSCLSHCEQGFALTVEDEVLVLENAEDFAAFLERLERVASTR
jgi:predicted metal-binding protein